MLDSILRLAAISIGVVILTFFAVVFVRTLSSKQQYSAPPHPWFVDATWTILELPPQELCTQPPPQTPAGIILEVPVRKSGDTWEVPCPESARPVADFLKALSAKRLLLKIEAGQITDLDKLVDSVSPLDASKEIAIRTGSQDVARDLRKRAPQWLYAADSASLLRLHVFEGLRLEPAMDFWPDFVIASMNPEDGSRLEEREVSELHRRKKRVLWNEVVSPGQAPFPVDGVLTGRITP